MYDQARVNPSAAGMTLTEVARMALAVEQAEIAALKREETAGALVRLDVVRQCWTDALLVMTTRWTGLWDTLPEQLAQVAAADGEAGVRTVLEEQTRAVLAEIQAAPATWPKDLRF